MILELLSAFCLLTGVVFLVLAAIGLVRMPDVFCRGHALGLASTLGIGLLLVALWLEVRGAGAAFKVILALLLQATSIPVASHLVGVLAAREKWEVRRRK